MSLHLIKALVKVFTLCIVVFAVSAFFIHDTKIIGWVIFLLGLICLAVLKLSKVKVKHVWPDITFGVVDNGFLAIFAIWGAEIAGVPGAIIGGVVGNAITDGLAGVFEGEMAEKMRANHISDRRTVLGSAVGKMAGCLLGAGFVLIVAGLVF